MQSDAPITSSAVESQANSNVMTQAASPEGNRAKPRPLWHVALIIMAIVFGPALIAWVVTLSH